VHIETILPQLTSLKHLDTWSQMLSPLSVKHAPPCVEALTYRIFPAQLLDLSETLALPGVLPSLKALEVKGAIPPGKLTPMQFTPTATQSIRTGKSPVIFCDGSQLTLHVAQCASGAGSGSPCETMYGFSGRRVIELHSVCITGYIIEIPILIFSCPLNLL
jgi:hypothetical protein